jgi:hypothetical protein
LIARKGELVWRKKDGEAISTSERVAEVSLKMLLDHPSEQVQLLEPDKTTRC